MKDAEEEIESLKNYITDLKTRIAVYIPAKGDPIDKKLAEYINNYADRAKLKIMFLRESEGVYEFGSKRVMVKVERDNIVIKVGGGFLSIDEFLDMYTNVELERIERRDPQKRFSDRIAVQKILASHVGTEKSPVKKSFSKSPRKSPTSSASLSPRKRPGTGSTKNQQSMFTQYAEAAKNKEDDQ